MPHEYFKKDMIQPDIFGLYCHERVQDLCSGTIATVFLVMQ